jgi:hypothetical protein
MVSEVRGRLFRRKDGKYLIYLPKSLAEDSMFPFKGADSIFVKVGFQPGGERLIVQAWKPKPVDWENEDWKHKPSDSIEPPEEGGDSG